MNVQPVPPIAAPEIGYAALAPVLIILGVAVLGVLVEAFVPRRARQPVHLVLAIAGLVAAFVAVGLLAGRREIAGAGAVAVDGPGLFLTGTLLVMALVAVFLIAERSPDVGGGAIVAQASAVPGSADERTATAAGWRQTEIFPLAMFSLAGMILFATANDLLLMFVALEVLSLPLYLMCGLARRRRLVSQEAAMKYFLLGAFSSAFFVYGLALLYGYANDTSLPAIAAATRSSVGTDGLLLAGMALLAVGLLFKVGAVPFHSWTPDVYQGAPTPVTAFMASATKVAAFGALLRVFYVAFPGMSWNWRPVAWGVAILTMLVGAVVAVTQTDMKRMLAYSAILNAGYILTGALALSRAGLSSTLFYLVAYGFATLAAFAIVTLVRDGDAEATHLHRWRGLGRAHPMVAVLFAFLLLAFAGIPLTSGFTAKFAVFSAAVGGGAWPVVIVGVIASAVSAFFYVRVIVQMFFNEPAGDGPVVAMPGTFTTAAISLGVLVTLVLGLWPGPLLQLTQNAALFVR